MRQLKIMAVELKIMQMSTVRRATMGTTGTKIRRKEAQLPWMTRTRIPTPGSPLRTHTQDNQQKILMPDNQRRTPMPDNPLKTRMQDSRLRILMLGSQQQKTRTMQGKILTTLQRILTQGVNPRSLMTLTEKKMIA